MKYKIEVFRLLYFVPYIIFRYTKSSYNENICYEDWIIIRWYDSGILLSIFVPNTPIINLFIIIIVCKVYGYFRNVFYDPSNHTYSTWLRFIPCLFIFFRWKRVNFISSPYYRHVFICNNSVAVIETTWLVHQSCFNMWIVFKPQEVLRKKYLRYKNIRIASVLIFAFLILWKL